MFIKWKSKANPQYLWSVLIQTLCSPTVGMNAVANEIGKKRDKLKESNSKRKTIEIKSLIILSFPFREI